MRNTTAFRGARRVTLLAAAALATTSAIALSACSSATSPAPAAGGSSAGGSSAPAAGGTFNLPLTTPDGTIDPLTTANFNTMFLVGLASAGLIIESPTGKLEPQLATSWTPAADKLSWTIKLRDGLKFSDGSPLTAGDVVATFNAILAPKSQSPAKSSFTGIVKSVAAGADPQTVVFTLAAPYSDFPYLLTGANTWILKGGKDSNWISDPVGAGQFILEKYTPGQGVTYKKNPNYWDAAHVSLDGVNAKFYADTQSQLLAFQSGEVDQISAGLSPSVPTALASGGYRQQKVGYSKFDGIVFNVTKAPFNDVKARQAVAWALDRKAIVQAAYSGEAVPGNDYTTFPDYGVQPQGIATREADKAKVAQLLGGQKVSFTITTYQGEQTLAELVQQQLNATGSFNVKLNVLTEAAYYGGSNATTPWLTAPVTITDWADRLPSQLYSLIYAPGSDWNASHYASAQLGQLATQYAAADDTQRQGLANQIAQLEWTDVPVIVPAFLQSDLYLGKRVQGTFPNGQQFNGGFDFRGITVNG